MPPDASVVKILSRSMVESALRDEAFVSSMPEFAGLRTSFVTLPSVRNVAGCCGGEVNADVERTFLPAFRTTMRALPADRLAALKRYFGCSVVLISVTEDNVYKTVRL